MKINIKIRIKIPIQQFSRMGKGYLFFFNFLHDMLWNIIPKIIQTIKQIYDAVLSDATEPLNGTKSRKINIMPAKIPKNDVKATKCLFLCLAYLKAARLV